MSGRSNAEPAESPVCTVCGSTEWTVAFGGRDARYGVPGQFTIRRCGTCGVMVTWPLPKLRQIPHLYPRAYQPHVVRSAPKAAPLAQGRSLLTRVASSQLFRLLRAVAGTTTYWMPPLQGGARVLEIGCGIGDFLARLAQRGWECYGVELSEQAARTAADRSGATVYAGAFESLDLGSRTFDAIFAFHVIEHLLDPREVLLKARELLRPSGYLVLSVPNADCWQMNVFKSRWHNSEIPRHLWHFGPAPLVRLLLSSGFTIEKLASQRHSTRDFLCSLGLVLRSASCYPCLTRHLMLLDSKETFGFRLATLPLDWAHQVLRQSSRLLVVARSIE